VNMQLRVCLCLLTVRLLVRHPRPRRGLRPSPTRRSSDLGGKKRRNSGQERVDPPLFDWPENEEERTLLMESLKESILYKRLKSYQWDAKIKQVFDFPDLQAPKPLEGRARRELMAEVPDLAKTAPCPGLKDLDAEDIHRVREADRWFCQTAAPRLHTHMYEELQLLAFIYQETHAPMEDGSTGTRLDLQEEKIHALLEKLIKLKMDSMQTLADFQIQRVRRATNREPIKRKEA